MGHTQCISQSPDSNPERGLQTRTTLKPVLLKSGHMVPGSSAVEKSLPPIRLKELDPALQCEKSTEDAVRVGRAMAHLHESGWYWGSLTAAQAKQVLSEALEGTFLLRDSSSPAYLLTLSVKTRLGPMHLRIKHSGGAFGFDSLAVARPHLRCFSGVVELVEHYALAPQRRLEEEEAQGGLQLWLTRPLPRAVPSLQHMCRITINRHTTNPQDLPLPSRLKSFLQDYPFCL